MRIYCTLFDKNYLSQGVALYNSLKKVAGEFKLYALCMDPMAYNMLLKLKSGNLIPISIDELLTPEISGVQKRTTHGQFCWVCQPLICQFVLDKFNVDMVTYLESDSLFFSDPEVLFAELKECSVTVVPHNYSPGYDQTSTSGEFCVQFNVFKNDKCGREVLEYWKINCFKYDKNTPLIHPGQTVLDEWPKKFECIKIIQHRGAGVAPWNIQHVRIDVSDSIPQIDGTPIVFYHYHQYGRYQDGSHELGNYPLGHTVIDNIYRKYINEIKIAESMLQGMDPTFVYRKEYQNMITFKELLFEISKVNLKKYLKQIVRKICGKYNVFPDKYFTSGMEERVM
jgi:hypothetical protein